jgi:hypothetical protein
MRRFLVEIQDSEDAENVTKQASGQRHRISKGLRPNSYRPLGPYVLPV